MTVGTDPSNADELCTKLKEAVAPTVAKSAALQTFCNEHTYVRFLRARQWNLPHALKMLQATLEWRLEYKPHLIRWADVQQQSVTGKQMVYPVTDSAGRPLILMRPRLENSKDTDRQIKFLIYHLEIASRMADKLGVGKMCWLLDFQGYTLANAPPIRVSLTCNSILQNHYPERLGQAICYHAPTLFSMTWKAVRPFVDVVTQQKILFVDKGATGEELMASHLHMEHMEECMGGRRPGLAFDLAEYEQRMLAYDKEVEDELAAAEAALRSLGASQPNSSQADLQVNVQEPVVPALKAGCLDNAAEAAEAAPPRS
ncbi:CRAL-TRIO domain-containing protein [Haematococcus lacustris]